MYSVDAAVWIMELLEAINKIAPHQPLLTFGWNPAPWFTTELGDQKKVGKCLEWYC